MTCSCHKDTAVCASDYVVNMEPPTKRRRLSDEYIEDEDASDADIAQRTPQLVIDNNISRIKARKQTPREEISTSAIPPTILESTSSTAPSFNSLGVDTWLTTALSHLSVKRPTRIQASCIPPILSGRDCIGGSRTGSGKTLAFALPILQKWAEDPSAVFAVILTPTRELALQIHEQIIALGSRRGLRCALVVGGADARQQAIELERRPHIVVATPGRLADHVLNSGEETTRGLKRVKFVVLDEADRLLANDPETNGKGSMLPDLTTCLSYMPGPSERQTLLFTATLTPEVRALQNLPRPTPKPPLHITEVDTETLAVPSTLNQTYHLVNILHKEKYLHILLLTPANLDKDIIIFVNRTSTATLLDHLLRKLDHRVTSLHSGLSHTDRTSNLARFRARSARILIATDVASRGLDIPDVRVVINYDIPRDPDTYIHRVGRTARAGRKGTSICLVGQRDVELIKAIEERVGREMVAYEEEGVNVETRVVREALNLVGEAKREVVLDLEEGRDVKGRRSKKMKRQRKKG